MRRKSSSGTTGAPRLRILDRPGVHHDDGSQLLGPSKPLALLARLLIGGDTPPRDEITALLWPGADDRRRARASLRSAIWTLRDRIGEEVLDTSGDRLALGGDPPASDWDDFAEALDRGDVERALELCGPSPLHELEIAGEREWNRWLDGVRIEILERLLSVGDHRTAALREAGEFDRADALLAALLRLSPLSVERWRDRVHLRIDAGRPAEGRAILGEAMRVLVHQADDDEAAAEALDVLDPLRARLDGDPGGGPEARRKDGAVLIRLPFVGRSAEIARLRRWLGRTDARTAAWILGPAGIGKTRLCEELLDGAPADVRGEPLRVVRTDCDRSDARARWATLVSVVRRLCSESGAAGISLRSSAILVNLAPSLSTVLGIRTTQPTPGAIEEIAVSDALLDLVDAVASEGPLLLVLDDLQWADDASLRAFRRLARGASGLEVRLLGTSRAGEIDREVLDGLRADGEAGRAEVFELDGFDRAATARAVRELMTAEEAGLVEAVADRLHDLSRGNPLALGSILGELRASGRLRAEDAGRWRFVGDSVDEIEIPTTLAELIRSRIETLSPDAWAILHRLAHAELPLLPGQLGDAASPAFTGAVRELIQRQLVERTGEGALRFPHEVTREVVRREMPALPRRRRSPWRHPVALAGAFAVLLTGALGVFAAGDLGSDPAPLYGGGAIVLSGDDGSVRLTHDGTGWISGPLPGDPGEGFPRAVPYALPDGIRWLGNGRSPARPVQPIEWVTPDSSRSIFDHPLDAGVIDLSPDRRHALIRADDPSTLAYDSQIWRVDLDAPDLDRTLILSGLRGSTPVRWSPDGTRLIVSEEGSDTHLLATPDGELLDRIEVPGAGGAIWCGSDRVLSVAYGPGTGSRWWTIPVTDRFGHPALVHEAPVAHSPSCSPDGGHAVVWSVRDGYWTLEIRSLADGRQVETVPLPPGVRPGADVVQWLDIERPAVPTGIEVVDSLTIPWGGSRELSAAIEWSRGARPTTPPDVEWSSLDPLVASVEKDGTLHANRPGRARILATVAGWIRDSIEVEVEGERPLSLLLFQDFDQPGLGEWVPFGIPKPLVEPSAFQPGRTLHLNGDGRWMDGVVSGSTFELPRGGRLEVEFRMELTRVDRQAMHFCLVPDDALDVAASEVDLDALEDSPCLRWPTGEGGLFRSDQITIFSASSHTLVPVDSTLADGDRWVRLSLVLRPDRFVEAWVDGEWAGTSILRFTPRAGPWRIGLAGKDVGTRLELRSVALWDGG